MRKMTAETLSSEMSKEQLLTLAAKYGTPLYVYNGNVIQQKYKELCSFFPWKALKVFYAMKANYNLAILRLLLTSGAGIDAVSEAEVLLAKKVGFKAKDILYTPNAISDEEMVRVQHERVLLNIDSLSLLERFGKKFPQSKICLRLNPDVVAGFHTHVQTAGNKTKFGISLADIHLALDIVKRYQLRVVGIHQHTGAGIRETENQLLAIENVLRAITQERFPFLEFVDMGSGFCIQYHPREERIDYHAFGERLVQRFSLFCKQYGKNLRLCFEPGRYLVAEASVLLISATTLKENNGCKIVGVDSGMNHLIRPMLYNAYHHIVNLSNPQGEEQTYDVYGNICETGDCFAYDRTIAKIHERDVLAIECTGAYGYAMGSMYNLRPMPAEVFVLNGKDSLITKRLTPAELVEKLV